MELGSVYNTLYPTFHLSLENLPHSITVYTSCFLGSEKFGSSQCYRTRKYSYILASCLSASAFDPLPGQIQRIFTHRFSHGGDTFNNIYCEVMWYKQHTERFKYGKALQLFDRQFSCQSFLPLSRVFSKFAPAFGNLHMPDEHVLFVCPVSRKFVM